MMKNKLKITIASIGLAIVILILPFAMGGYGNLYHKVIGKQSESVRREVFKENKSYVEGMVQDLAKYKRELDKETDPTARQGIITFIQDEFANFDESNIESDTLRSFLYDVKSGMVQ